MWIVKGEYFDRWTWTCENSTPALAVIVDGLIHCAIRCTSDDYCKTFSFIRETNMCNLYSLKAPCCNDSITGNSLTFRQRTKVCEFTLVTLQTAILPGQCDVSFLQLPLTFRIKGTGQAKILLFGNGGHQFAIHFENTSSNGNILDLTYMQLVSKKYFREDYNPNIWSYYWVTIVWNGTTGIGLGMDGKPGCNSLGEVFQRRKDGSEDFYRNWTDYKYGFGNKSGEFWLGNHRVHEIVSQGYYELRIDMTDFAGENRFAVYRRFSVGNESQGYTLMVEDYQGTAGDSMTSHNGAQFYTKDRDTSGAIQCADRFKGGWWYKMCHAANLNGLYLSGTHSTFADGIEWKTWHGYNYSLKFTEMKMRRL
ncbi:hypothetical protein FSP39_019450 [Pinctada imbricata]|uniref:Fibrinogen C-terminal domain-containing protein n=1 Tax=Pinctada imbricata TaxID=66713 RepID=A0AA88YRZ8_PINIB|nr:hypothetical protein FSP39_019450 [Pinctada imbricata]